MNVNQVYGAIHIQDVDQNVLPIQIVHLQRLVYAHIAVILAKVLVVLEQIVRLLTIYLYVHAHLVPGAMHLKDVTLKLPVSKIIYDFFKLLNIKIY